MHNKDLPNILVVSTHDSGRHFGCCGVPTVRTPEIDALAEEGVIFENVVSPSPICSPARGGLLTGRYPLSNGLVGLAGGRFQWELTNYRDHLSWILQEAGYRTAMIGLQHETSFVDRLGFEDTSAHGVSPAGKESQNFVGWPVAKKGRSALDVADDAVAFLRSAAKEKKPFYAQIGFFETHTPFDFADCPTDDELGVWEPSYARNRSVPAWAKSLVRYLEEPDFAHQHLAGLQGAIARVDAAVGKIRQALKKFGLDENTILLFTTDHGVELPGAKWTLHGPGLGVAFLLRWPAGGIMGGRRCPDLLGQIDFVPTLLDLLGLPAPGNLDGVSFANLARGERVNAESSGRYFFGNWVDGLQFSVRSESHNLIRHLASEPGHNGLTPPEWEFFDLVVDPEERRNVAGDPAKAGIFTEMKTALEGWLADQCDPSMDGSMQGGDLLAKVEDYRSRYLAGRKVPAASKLDN